MSSSEPGPTSTVFVSDESERREIVGRVVSSCEAEVSPLPAWEPAQARSALHDSVVLMALQGSPPDYGACIERVRHACESGCSVIAYADGSSSWPIGDRCKILLAGAFDLLDSESPGFARALEMRLRHLLDSERRRYEEREATRATMHARGLVGSSPPMMDVFRLTLKAAPLSDLPVLVVGETGTGKELLARAIHGLDPKRSRGPLVALNCAALTKSLADSELFGHRRGAFTGADRDRKGLIRAADGGVIFLDEVAELDLELQAKLLRVLQEGRVLGVGQEQEVPVSVRVIAATHRDLAERVKTGQFREDLLYRLKVLPIYVPPLRERPDDLPLLVAHFLEKHHSLRPTLVVRPSGDFLEALASMPWPGNARQLENLIRRVLASKENDLPLELRDLPREVWQELSPATPVVRPAEAERATGPPVPTDPVVILDSNEWKLGRSLAHVERLFLKAALDRTGGNQSRTARLLGITPRSVYSKLRKYELHS